MVEGEPFQPMPLHHNPETVHHLGGAGDALPAVRSAVFVPSSAAPAGGLDPPPDGLTARCPTSWATPERIARPGLEPGNLPLMRRVRYHLRHRAQINTAHEE